MREKAIGVEDIQRKNIIRDQLGNIRVIDADMKLHTKDVRGDFSYPPVEDDIKGESLE